MPKKQTNEAQGSRQTSLTPEGKPYGGHPGPGPGVRGPHLHEPVSEPARGQGRGFAGLIPCAWRGSQGRRSGSGASSSLPRVPAPSSAPAFSAVTWDTAPTPSGWLWE